MSTTKFEQLLEYLIIEGDTAKSDAFFHQWVVETSQDIYNQLLAEEIDAEDDDTDSKPDGENDEDTNEGMDQAPQSQEYEEAFEPEGDPEGDDEDGEMPGGEPEDDGVPQDDDLGPDASAGMDDEGGEDSAMYDIRDAISALEAAFKELEASHGAEDGMGSGEDEFSAGDDDEANFSGDELGGDASDDFTSDVQDPTHKSSPMAEARRKIREYTEKVGSNWEASGTQKTQGEFIGAGTGEKSSKPSPVVSPISSGKGKPSTGANAGNLMKQSDSGSQHGTKPHGKTGGFVKDGGKVTPAGTVNVDGVKSGVKTAKKVTDGHGAEKKGRPAGPVGAGKGDLAGQTKVDPATKRQFLPSKAK